MILSGPWNTKASLWLKGRRNIFGHIRSSLGNTDLKKVVWMHCASLGEFEQGRPVLENLKRYYPEVCIVLTFFSPSGYEEKKTYEGADFIFYLPVDSAGNAKEFLNIINPALILWVKYEYWYYYITEVKRRNIPLLLISAIFRRHQLFFKPYGSLYRRMLHCFTQIFVQDNESATLLNTIGLKNNVTVSGDTRFDRVIEIAGNSEAIERIEEFCHAKDVIVAGSTWLEDEEELSHFANVHPEIRFIIAPHEIGPAHLRQVKKLFRNSVFFSQLPVVKKPDADKLLPSPAYSGVNVLIIDNIGMLSRLYKYASVSYIGGGFGQDGVHNVLEAAVYGKPVVFGPVFDKYIEAEELVNSGGAFPVENALQLEERLNLLLSDKHKYEKACKASAGYVYSKKGAKQKILDYIVQQGFGKSLLATKR